MRITIDVDDQMCQDAPDDPPRRATFPLVPTDSRSTMSDAEAQRAIADVEAEDDADRAGS
jgi:hypothetical protein